MFNTFMGTIRPGRAEVGLGVDAFVAGAAERGIPLKVVDIRDAGARTLYERDLVLIRPDHHVAWRGDAVPDRPEEILDRIRGAAQQFGRMPTLVGSIN